MKFSKLSEHNVRCILGIFSMFFMCFNGYYMCHNESFRKIVEKLYYPDPQPKDKLFPEPVNPKKELHRQIGLIFDKAANNVRKLEEEATHFFRAEEFFSLKQSISTIENFLMLFNPITKFDLFRYWRKLEQRGYDPVTEYNKGVEQFDTQYIPEPDKLFVIILQVCRFLKEFSDFETDVTPIFRHPMIKGKVGVKLKQAKSRKNEDEMPSSMDKKTKELGSRSNSLAKLGSTQKQNISRDTSLKKGDHNTSSAARLVPQKKSIITTETTRKRRRLDPLGTKEPFYNKDNELSDIDEPDTNQDREKQPTFNYLEKIGLLKELRQFKLTKDLPTSSTDEKSTDQEAAVTEKYSNIESRFAEILEEWEDVNVDNPRGRQRFREHYEKLIFDKYHFKRNEGGNFDDDRPTHDQKSIAQDHNRSQKHLMSELKLLEAEEDKKKHEYLEKIDDIDLEIKSEKVPSFYYYKR